MRRALKILVILMMCIAIGTSCSVIRHIPDGQYLLQKVRIEDDKSTPRKERVTPAELEKYVRQSPNKRFLGTNFYAWFYTLANPKKDNRWNNFKRKVGQEPVILDMALTEKSVANLKAYMDSKGFFSSRASFEVDTTTRRKRAFVTYRTVQNQPYRIDSISYDFRDKFLQQIILPDTAKTLIHNGSIFDITMLDTERERITAYLRERGYFNFSVNNIEYIADTLVGNNRVNLKVVIKQYLTGYNERGVAVMDNNTVYRIDEINIFPNFDPTIAATDTTYLHRQDSLYYRGLNVVYEGKPNIRPYILRQAVPLYPNYIYNSQQIDRTYLNLMSLGYFKSAKVSFVERPTSVEERQMITFVGESADSTKTHYTREGYLQCNILCIPAKKQSFKVELEGSTTSSFYGLSATLGYQNRNIFRGAEAFDASFKFGYEFMKAPSAQKRTAKEFGITTGLSFPRFLLFRASRFKSINQPRTKLELSVNFQDRPYYRRTLTGATWTYSWSNKHYSSFSLRPIDLNIIDMGYIDENFFQELQNLYLRNSYKTQLSAGLSFGYVYNNQRKNLGRNATVIRFNVETAGNLIDGLEHLFSKRTAGQNYYSIFGIQYSQYVRTDLSLSRKIMLGEKSALAGRVYGGFALAYGNSTSVPFDRLFYAGGSNSMRGWTPRTLGPGSTKILDTVYPSQLGDMKLEANVELRFPIWGILNGATFADVGNIWFMRSYGSGTDEANAATDPNAIFHFNSFYKQLALDAGIGLRLDIKFAILRLDWGIQIHNPNNPAGDRWIHSLKWKNTALNFGVGYPF